MAFFCKLSGNLRRNTMQKVKTFSRRNIVVGGAIAGFAGALGLPSLSQRVLAASSEEMQNDLTILNNALYYEHQAIWAYSFAAGKLSSTDVGKAVLAIALANQADHKEHRDALAAAVRSLGGTPVEAESSTMFLPISIRGKAI
jgi:Ferritin-like domain